LNNKTNRPRRKDEDEESILERNEEVWLKKMKVRSWRRMGEELGVFNVVVFTVALLTCQSFLYFRFF